MVWKQQKQPKGKTVDFRGSNGKGITKGKEEREKKIIYFFLKTVCFCWQGGDFIFNQCLLGVIF